MREWPYNVYRRAGAGNQPPSVSEENWELVAYNAYHRFLDENVPLASEGNWYIIRHMLEDGTENSPSAPLFVRNASLPPIRGSAFPKPQHVARHWYHKDHLGTPRLVTGENGEIISQHDYEPFGVELTRMNPEAANNPNTHRFTGHERDNETGLDYMMARYFMSRDARFTSIDPSPGNLQNPQSQNRYNYTLNNPMKFVDPTGKIAGARNSETKMMSSNTNTGDPFGVNLEMGGKPGHSDGGAFAQLSAMMAKGFASPAQQEQDRKEQGARVAAREGELKKAHEADQNGGKGGDVPETKPKKLGFVVGVEAEATTGGMGAGAQTAGVVNVEVSTAGINSSTDAYVAGGGMGTVYSASVGVEVFVGNAPPTGVVGVTGGSIQPPGIPVSISIDVTTDMSGNWTIQIGVQLGPTWPPIELHGFGGHTADE